MAEWVRDQRPELAMDFERIERSYMRIKLALEAPFKTVQTRGIWIKGEPGIGKSHLLMENYHDQLYEKS